MTDPKTPKILCARLELELTTACDHRCAHCYNVWNANEGEPQGGYARGTLPTEQLKALWEKAVRQSGATQLTLTGGEPLLHPDALALVRFATALVPRVHLVSNASQITTEVAKSLAHAGLASAQLTLLAPDPETHDRLKGVASFEQTVRAALDLQEAGVRVQICFVATPANEGCFEGVLELAHALGVGFVVYNRASLAGRSARDPGLAPTKAQVEADLQAAELACRRFGLKVGTAMPIPPCIIRLARYPSVRFGFCSQGSAHMNPVIDPQGQVRPCNLSRQVLGDLRTQDLGAILAHPYAARFRATLPPLCQGCSEAHYCRGGCKESAFAAFGDHRRPEPFLAPYLR